jgi:histidinol phosphatase-like PHP family hydrolase
MFSPEMIAKFDYVFTDSMTWTNDRGKRMRLWMPNEVEVGDKQKFMDMLVDRTVGILNDEPIDIYVNPTFLPAVIAKEYDTLWTEERMDRVIQAAVKNGVAIEINARYRLPSEKFIKRAKAAGATFSFGTNNGGRNDLGDLAYSRLMAVRCGLMAADMFVPKPDGQKPIQKKGLPK